MVIRKNWLKKVLCLTLAFTMTIGLSACGGESDGDGGNKGSKDGKKVNSELAKQFVYKESEFDLSLLGDKNSYYVNSVEKIGDKLYFLAGINQYNYNTDKSNNYLRLLSMNQDGSDGKVVDLLLDGQVIWSQDELGTPDYTNPDGPVIYEGSVGAKGAKELSSAAVDVALPYPEKPSQVYENTYYGSMKIGKDAVYTIKNHYYEDYSDPENPIYENSTSICAWKLDGAFLFDSKIEGLENGERYAYVRDLLIDAAGKVNILLDGDQMEIMSMNEQGVFSDRKPFAQKVKEKCEYIDGYIQMPDGSVLVTYYNNDYTEFQGTSVDLKTGAVGETIKLPREISWNGNNGVAVIDKNQFLYGNDTGIFKYQVGKDEPEQILNYVNSDIFFGNLEKIIYLDEEHMILNYRENSNWEDRSSLFTKVDPKDIKDKDVIVLGGLWIDGDLKQRAIEYNKADKDFRIVMRDYSIYNTDADYNAGETRLNADIIAGNMPDIMMPSYNANMDSYIKKGLLADIGELIAKDPELSKIEYMENVFEAYKVNGKLYYVIPSFEVQTVVAKKSIVGDRRGWTIEEMQQELAKHEGMQAFGEMTQDNFIYSIMEYGSGDFMDLAAGKCSFDSDSFIGLLEYAKSLPAEINNDDSHFDDDWYMKYQSQYRENRTMLMSLYISDFTNVKSQIKGYMGEDVAYVGFPTANRTGSLLSASSTYVLSAKSKCLDGAWDFIKYYLTPEYQTERTWGLPTIKSELKKRAQLATRKSFWLDENGNEVEYDDYFYINGEEVVLEPLSQAQVDELLDFIGSVKARSFYNEDLQNIVTEEVAAFFKGQKSAADVAKIIQSRAQLYLNENN